MNILAHLRHINSMTKYPSIETYHRLDPKTGMLQDEFADFGDQLVYGTEKVNGTNCRIIVFPDGDWIIGSREELLHASGDRIANPALGIVAAAIDTTRKVSRALIGTALPWVFYLEAYGHGIDGGRQYTRTHGVTGLRLFDIVQLPEYNQMLEWPIEKVASWRQHGGQTFLEEWELAEVAERLVLSLAPRLFEVHADELPREVDETREFLAYHLPATTVALDGEPGKAEGLVLRTADRKTIVKARFEDYDRTLRRRGSPK